MANKKGVINKKRVAALVFLIVLVIILVFLVWWWFLRELDTEEVGVNTNTSLTNEPVVLPRQEPQGDTPLVSEIAPLTSGELEVMTLARNFTERYGSWSTESNFRNLTDLYPNITNSLQLEFQTTIATAARPAEFKGIDTKVIRVQIDELTDQRARVTAMTQRVETAQSGDPRVFYENLLLTMVRQGQFWRVDTAEWQ